MLSSLNVSLLALLGVWLQAIQSTVASLNIKGYIEVYLMAYVSTGWARRTG